MSQQTLSGVMLCLYGKGILIRGPSGIGKSECALKLIDRGHQLLSDDAVCLEKIDHQLIASAPEILYGCLNIRELGIIPVEHHFGLGALIKKQRLDLVIQLIPDQDQQNLNEIPQEESSQSFMDIEVPCIQLTASPQRDLALLIEMAAMKTIQAERGININQAFITQVNETLGQAS